MKTVTRKEFLKAVDSILDDFENDHEEHTGYDDQHEMPMIRWWEEIRNAIENTS